MKTRSINDMEFERGISSGSLFAIACFWAEWSFSSRIVKMSIEAAAARCNGPLDIFLLEADQCKASMEKFNVQKVPTVVYFCSGREIRRETGMMSGQFIDSKIESLMPNTGDPAT